MTFTVGGPLMGAVRTTQRQKWVDPRYKRYAAFKQRIRVAATAAGVPEELAPRTRAAVCVWAKWRRGPRVDLDNICKAVLDGMWKNDRRVWRLEARNWENAEEETLTVMVEML